MQSELQKDLERVASSFQTGEEKDLIMVKFEVEPPLTAEGTAEVHVTPSQSIHDCATTLLAEHAIDGRITQLSFGGAAIELGELGEELLQSRLGDRFVRAEEMKWAPPKFVLFLPSARVRGEELC